MTFTGKRYPLSIGGVSLGATSGASKAMLVGTASNLRQDIAGTDGATEAGVAVLRGTKRCAFPTPSVLCSHCAAAKWASSSRSI